MLFFTTGEISADGWDLCRKSGVVAMDGEMLASFLADKDIAIEDNGITKSFDADRFIDWLAN